MKKKYLLFFLLFAFSFGTDIASKFWALHRLQPIRPNTIAVIPGYFEFRYAGNTGMAFSIGADHPWASWILTPIGIIALVLLLGWLYRLPKDASVTGAKLGLLVGGALGNMLDRIVNGKVTDFIVWKLPHPVKLPWIGMFQEWPTFNLADAFLLIGVLLVLLNLPKDRAMPSVEAKDTKPNSSKS